MDDQTRLEIEAAAFRRLRHHLLVDRPDAQNIDMMNLAGFCRNCLSRWYQEAAAEHGVVMDKGEAREVFYGLPSSLAMRAATKNQSLSRFKYFTAAGFTLSMVASSTVKRSARRATVRHWCKCADNAAPPGRKKLRNG